MRILVEILHPAHVHFFRHFIAEMESRGNEFLITSRAKDVTTALLNAYGIPHRVLSEQRRGALGLGAELLERTRKLLHLVEEFQPNVMTGIMGPTITLAGKWKRIRTVVFYDTESATMTNPWVYRLADVVCTPDSYGGKVPGHHIRYAGYHDLAYLHPNRFTPDPERLRGFGLNPSRPFSLGRFVAFEASHDFGDRGLSREGKVAMLRHLAQFGEVVVSTEGSVPPDLPAKRLSGPAADIHHVLAAAQIVVGDSGTMSSEAAVLGTPAVFVSTARLSVLRDLEATYGLLANRTPDDLEGAIAAVTRLQQEAKTGYLAIARQRLLADKVDVTSWMVEFFSRVPWHQQLRQ